MDRLTDEALLGYSQKWASAIMSDLSSMARELLERRKAEALEKRINAATPAQLGNLIGLGAIKCSSTLSCAEMLLTPPIVMHEDLQHPEDSHEDTERFDSGAM